MTNSEQKADGISVVIPVYNEELSIAETINRVNATLSKTERPFEIIVVDDGSSDRSNEIASACEGVKVVRHPRNAGYGRALKSGIISARYPWIGIVDADGTYPIEDFPALIEVIDSGFDMAVGHRSNISQRDRPVKRMFRRIFIWTLCFLLKRHVADPNSGFRLFNRAKSMELFPFLSDAFSFTTSLTVNAFSNSWFIKYVPIVYEDRVGKTKVSHLRDTLRTTQLIVQGIAFSNPVKFSILLIFALFILVTIPSMAVYLLIDHTIAYFLFATGAITILMLSIGVVCDTLRLAIGLRDWNLKLDRNKTSS